MFTSILDTAAGSLTLTSALTCIGAAVLFGLVISLVYMRSSERCTKNFVITLALLPVLVEVIILMTSGSLGTAVAVAGAFSLVRFRSLPGTSREIAGIFFAMAVGLSCGMGQVLFGGMITLVISAIFFLLSRTRFGEKKEGILHLKVTIPEDLDYTGVFDDIFERYCSQVRREKVRTVNLGSMYELDYSILLKDAAEEKEMIDAIRVRNGNLTVVCGKAVHEQPELL